MKKNRIAFTLVELLIAVAIFSIIALSLYSSFHAGIKILQKSQEVTKLHQDLRIVLEEMSLDLRNSLACPIYEETKSEPAPEAEAIEEEEEEPVYYFLGQKDRFSFVTLKETFSDKGRPMRQICNITYYLKEGGLKKLMRMVRSEQSGFLAGPDTEETLLTGIEDMEVLYSYKNEDEEGPPIWLFMWEEEELVPLGVKVKLKLKGLGKFKDFTKTVFIPVGALGMLEEEGESRE